MQIEKIAQSFYNRETKGVEEKITYRISYKSLMVIEETLEYAFKKMIMFAVYKKVLSIKK